MSETGHTSYHERAANGNSRIVVLSKNFYFGLITAYKEGMGIPNAILAPAPPQCNSENHPGLPPAGCTRGGGGGLMLLSPQHALPVPHDVPAS
jgi:hypothetical protein